MFYFLDYKTTFESVPNFLGILSELDVDVNEGSLMELQGHIGRFQVTDSYFSKEQL